MASKPKNKSDMVFVIRPSEFGEFLPFPEMALTAYLKQEGFKVSIVDPMPLIKKAITISDPLFDKYFDYVKKEIIRLKPRFIGLGTFTSDYDFIMHFAERIKEYSDAKIIVGNVHATVMPKDFVFKGSPVDFSVIGEGELTLVEILSRKPLTPSYLEKIDGICFYDAENDKAVETKRRGLMPDLSKLPVPAYDAIDMSYYIRPVKRVIGYAHYVVVPVYSGRGCPFRCKFCAAGSVWGQRLMRPLPIDNVIKEIKYLIKKYNIDAVYVIDDTFTINKARVLEFCEKVKPLNIVWAAQTRVNLIDDEMVRIMRDSGCTQLTLGVETGSQKLLDLMKKDTTVEQIREAFAICKKYKMRTLANMMFNLPGETKKDVQASYDLFEEINPDEFGLGLTVAYPGTDIYDEYFPHKLDKDEYYLLAEARGVGKGRFRLCKHDLDFEELLVDFRMNLKIQHLFPLFIRILINKEYLVMIKNSKYRDQYVHAILKDLPVGLMRTAGVLAYNLVRMFPAGLRRPFVKLAIDLGKKYGN